MLLKGFGFSGYRSIGDKLVKIGPLKKVNMIIGRNNAGKSNIVNYLNEQYGFHVEYVKSEVRILSSFPENPFKDIDHHLSSEGGSAHRISFPLFEEDIDSHIAQKLPDEDLHIESRRLAKKVLCSAAFFDAGVAWFTYKSRKPHGLLEFELEADTDVVLQELSQEEWSKLKRSLNVHGGSRPEYWISSVLKALVFIPETLPNIEVIPAIRKIGVKGSNANDFSGEGIIDRVAKLQNPSSEDQHLKGKFQAINEFIREILENPTARIEVPYERDTILIHMDGKTLPLSLLGTGIHEVVILAAAATLLDNTILCIEEPELHLHPFLQRKLVKYLSEKTKNQYFFTTHSAHLLDAVESQIFHITQIDGISNVEAISSTEQHSNICSDLGYKASDILQANSVIWVAGPSDRIYLNFWLESYSAEHSLELVEGVHYSIMFYGGRLSSHLTALDMGIEADDLISIRKLNRNTVIIFDSDKDRPEAQINSTKQRLKDEFDSGVGFAWVTSAREVENYLDPDKVEESVKTVHPSANYLVNKGEWANILIYRKKGSTEERTASKVKVAHHYVENNIADLSVLDLRESMNELVSFIHVANGHEI